MTERMPSFTELPIAEVIVPTDRLRPVSEAKVAALVKVIGEGVFLGAITVRRVGTKNTLIDGAHRMEAMKRLGHEMIRADVLNCNAGEARRMEITGNITAGMTPLQDAIFLGVYQEEYEKLHPETKRGVAGALARNGVQTTNLSFAELIAETRQIVPRQVQRLIKAGRDLPASDRLALQAVPHRIPISEIEKLGKIGDAPLRSRAVAALLEGKAVKDALRAEKAERLGEKPPVKDRVEDEFNALSKAWDRASLAARKKFLLQHARELWAAQNKGAALTDWANTVEPEGEE